MHSADSDVDPWDAPAAIARLAELGYIEAPGEDDQKAVENVRCEQLLLLAQVHSSSGRPRQAKRLLLELLEARPGHNGHMLMLAQCHLSLGELTAARAVLNGGPAGVTDLPI